jgi:hypothetical protein
MSCKSAGQEYSEGALICANGRELRCHGGDWQETGYSCSTYDDEKYLRISPDGKFAALSTAEVAGAVRSNHTLALGCVVNTVAPIGSFRLVNTCSKCQVALLSWSNGDFDRISIEAGGVYDGQMKGMSFTIAGSVDCANEAVG